MRLHDDLLRYLADTLSWIPTYPHSKAEPSSGLCMWGITRIEVDGAHVARAVFSAWADLLSLGPDDLRLTGSYVNVQSDRRARPRGVQAISLEGGYQDVHLSRQAVVSGLRVLATWCQEVADSGGSAYVVHFGV